jgi:hypothetical protein
MKTPPSDDPLVPAAIAGIENAPPSARAELESELANHSLSLQDAVSWNYDLFSTYFTGLPAAAELMVEPSGPCWTIYLLGHYFMQAYVEIVEPERAELSILINEVAHAGFSPPSAAIKQERLQYFQDNWCVGDNLTDEEFSWYIHWIGAEGTRLSSKHGFQFLHEFVELFPWDGDGPTTEKLVDSLDVFSPGFKSYALPTTPIEGDLPCLQPTLKWIDCSTSVAVS